MNEVIVTSSEAIKEIIKDVLVEVNPLQHQKEEEQFLSKKEAAGFLRMSESSIDNLRRKGHLRSYTTNGTSDKRVGNVLFLKSELIEDIRKSSTK